MSTDDHDDGELDELIADLDTTPRVAASEADLIAMARALVAPHAYDVWALMAAPRQLPPRIGPTCATLIEDALRQVWPALWRRDGARPAATIANRALLRGWERHPPTPLAFSAATMALLRWLVSRPLATTDGGELATQPLAIGDQVAIYLVLDAAAASPALRALVRQPMIRAAPLAWLGFAHAMSGEPPAFDSLVTGAGAIVVEALSRELATRWRGIEINKRSERDPDALIALGAAQDATLTGFMAACELAGRRDLAGFVVDAAAPLLERGIAPLPAALDLDTTMGKRAAARLAAGALLRAVSRWHAWDNAHRGVRFIDDDYAAAQLLLSRFERIGPAGVDRASLWLAELASLAPAASPSATIEAP